MNGVDDVVATGLHFLRPAWLLGLPALAALALWWWRRGARAAASGWDAVVDPALRPYVIEGGGDARRPRAPYALFAGWALACLVLSGPVFERREVEVRDAPAVAAVLLDLSASMRGDDLRPDRVTRVRFELDALLGALEGVEVALVAFAERPYTVAPPTDDAATVRAFLPSLVPEIAPLQGSRPDLAIARGVELLERGEAGTDGPARGGRLLLVTDAVPDEATFEAARRARRLGHALSVLGVGTADGAPLRDADGRFAVADDGSIVVPRVDAEALARLASAGGGGVAVLDAGGLGAGELDALRAGLESGTADVDGDGERAARRALWWVERSPWLVPVLAAGSLLAFRRKVEA